MQASNGSIILTVIICTVLLGAFSWIMMPETPEEVVIPDFPTAEAIAALIIVGDNQDVIDILNEDDDWKDLAEEIATAEWEDRDYRDIYKAINEIAKENPTISIDDRDDIKYVREDEVTAFSGMDVDDKDATVTQYVKVRYENDNGDMVTIYLDIRTEIEDGEIEDQVITLIE